MSAYCCVPARAYCCIYQRYATRSILTFLLYMCPHTTVCVSSAIGDAPPTPMSSAKTACSEAHASAEDSKDSSEGDYYEAKAQMEDERRYNY